MLLGDGKLKQQQLNNPFFAGDCLGSSLQLENAWQNPKRQLSEQMKTKYKAQTLQDGPYWRKDVTANVGWLRGNTKDRNQQNVLIRWSSTLPQSLHCAYQFGTQTSPKMKRLPLSLWKLLHFLWCSEKHPSYTDLKQTKESLGRWFWDRKNIFTVWQPEKYRRQPKALIS